MPNTLQDEPVKFNNIIQLMKNDVRNGMEIFYYEYGKIIKHFIRKLFPYPDKIEETLNDILSKIWLLSQNLGYIKKPYSWLRVITKNHILDTIKCTKQTYALEDNIPSSENPFQSFLDKCVFDELISDLPQQKRDIIEKKIIDRYTFEEIAQMYDLPLSTVSSKYYRSLDSIKKKYLKINNKA